MSTKNCHLMIIACLMAAALFLSVHSANAQVPHTILAMVRDDADSTPLADQAKFLAYIKDMSDGGVHSETRTDDDTGNAYGDGVMGAGWLELECANFTQFEWANGDSLRLAIVNMETNQLSVTSIKLDAAVEPQLENTLYLESSLIDFHGRFSSDQVDLEWSLEGSDIEPSFHIYRGSAEEGPFQRLNLEPIEAHEPYCYCYCDDGISEGSIYYYQLGLAEFSDSVMFFGPILVTARTDVASQNEAAVPLEYGLSQNYPNPFNPETTIEYQLPETAPVRLAVYNLLGQHVRSLVNEVRGSGYHRVTWDGRDDGGDLVASGVYFCYLTAGSYHQVRKMTFLK